MVGTGLSELLPKFKIKPTKTKTNTLLNLAANGNIETAHKTALKLT